MTSATLKQIGEQHGFKLMLVEFQRCSIFDAFMFKNNVFNWLFTNTLDEFQISDDNNNGFMVRMVENRDVRKFINIFDKITFTELDV
jgi:hypothetical protein